ncbi:response regulator [Granulicella arctica]|uniref:DNA-binding response OmpR family regulator n=1 Tax=Granulicella arctica TaxID=940613 RepID=A0A7Y9PJX4_9BACT|nr:response regulator [Granulicella arctica]NYF80418.1 DNA-binding response OmpR family regulator [Granulicella arctica]
MSITENAGSMNSELFTDLKQSTPAYPLSPKTILFVDDDEDIRALTKTFLEHEGYSVFCCGDAERAGHVFRSASRIDLLITDFYMPKTSGMDLALELRQQNPRLPILLISGGFVWGDNLKRLLGEGWRFLGKPFALPELLATVHAILGGGAMQAIA